MEAIGSSYRPPSLSWHTMFQQLKDIHDLGHTKARIPPRIIRWMSTQQRQYRVYGIGLKEPVGIIKQRVNKLNSLGFEWNPALVHSSDRTTGDAHDHDDGDDREEAEEETRESHVELSSASKVIDVKQNPSVKKRERDNAIEADVYSGSVTGITQRGPGKKWEVRVSLNGGKRKYIGSYETHAEAIAAMRRAQGRSADKAKRRLHSRPEVAKQWKVVLHRRKKSTLFGCYQSHAEAVEAVRQAKRKLKTDHGKFTIQQPTDNKNSKGVTLRGDRLHGKWEVRVCHEGKRRYIGCFDTQAEATEALRRARNKINSDGTFAELGETSSLAETQELRRPLRMASRRVREAHEKNPRSMEDDESNDENDEDSDGAVESVEGIEEAPKCAKNEERAASNMAVNRAPPTREKKLKIASSKKKNHLVQIKGITQRRNGKWEVRFFHKGVRRYIGSFNSQADALRALQEERKKVKSKTNTHAEKNQVEEASDDSESAGHEHEKDHDDANDSDDGSVEADDSSEGEEQMLSNGFKRSPGHSYFPKIVFKMVNDSSVSCPEVRSNLLLKAQTNSIVMNVCSLLVLYSQILEWLPCGSAFRVHDQVSRCTKFVAQ
ncbi:hypothetical protein HJC23_008338 [Cyclotella cryptica]|uniref:AP2/ERF domain-containing protein n=1 Tax=Cyclotella cryptica TaxID=29204 RepID=A0ABD3Q526_9STRA